MKKSEEILKITISDYLKLAKGGVLDNADKLPSVELFKWMSVDCPQTEIITRSKQMASLFQGIKVGKLNPEIDTLEFCYIPDEEGDPFIIINTHGEMIMEILLENDVFEEKYVVLSVLNDFNSVEPVFKTNSKKELIKWLNVPWTDEERAYWLEYTNN